MFGTYYIWCDESEKHGTYYSNFYGGILIRSSDYLNVIDQMSDKVTNLGLEDEIKWQKVNEHHYEPYKELVDLIFELLAKDLIKIRIFFRHNKNVPVIPEATSKHDEYLKLYYQFIKHSFGLQFSNNSEKMINIHLFLDDIPMDGNEKEKFKQFIVGLTNEQDFRNAHIVIKRENIAEVESKKHLPLQLMDLILGSMDFRLNNKHKVKPAGQRVRGKRTIVKEKLYKYINKKIRELRPGFNVGVSTSYTDIVQRWTDPYRHWSFVPSNCITDSTMTKRHMKHSNN